MKEKAERELLEFCRTIKKDHPGFFEFLDDTAGEDGVGLFALYLHFLKKKTRIKSLKLKEFWDYCDDIIK